MVTYFMGSVYKRCQAILLETFHLLLQVRLMLYMVRVIKGYVSFSCKGKFSNGIDGIFKESVFIYL